MQICVHLGGGRLLPGGSQGDVLLSKREADMESIVRGKDDHEPDAPGGSPWNLGDGSFGGQSGAGDFLL